MKKPLLYLLVLLVAVFSTSCTQSSKGTFEVGDKTFLLNGEPFVVKAAEIHYPRIPKEYWEHRIKMSKALGMNTICLYDTVAVPWQTTANRTGILILASYTLGVISPV